MKADYHIYRKQTIRHQEWTKSKDGFRNRMKRKKRNKGKGILAVGLFAAAGLLLFSFRNKIAEDPDMSGETADMIASFEKIDLSEEATQETKVKFELEILEKEDSGKDRENTSIGRASSIALKAGVSNLPKSKEAIWEMLLYNIPGYGHGEKELPESLRKLYVVNEEARDFVLAYDEKKNKHFKIDLTREVTKGTVPALLQWDERWGYEKYGEGLIAVNGCGPTTLSMVYMGLSGDTSMHPLAMAKLAEEKGYYVSGSGSAWSMMKDLARSLGLDSRSGICDVAHIKEQLSMGHPVICIMGPGDFTYNGHFIVLTGMTKDGKIKVNDPNSRKNTEAEWDAQTIVDQTKNLWFVYGYSEQIKIDYENSKVSAPVVNPAETDQTADQIPMEILPQQPEPAPQPAWTPEAAPANENPGENTVSGGDAL